MKLKQVNTLHLAQRLVQEGALEALQHLLQEKPALVSWQHPADNEGRMQSLLHLTTGWEEKRWSENAKAIAHMLIDRGAEINAKDKEPDGETALHLAVSINNVEVSQVLLELGAETELHGKFQSNIDTALGYALFYGADESLEKFRVNCPALLLRYGAKIFLPFAAAMNEINWVKRCFNQHGNLSSSAGIGSRNLLLSQALLFACRYGHIEICDYLLYQGAKINAMIPFFEHHATALHLACEQGQQTELVNFLLRKGANPALKDLVFDATPVGWAMFYGQDEVFRLLHKRNWA